MASEKMLEVEESQDTPQAITITIVDPSALGNTSLDSSLVASVETQDGPHPGSSIVMVSGDSHGTKNILQTVTETHMGTEDLPIISNISNTEEDEEEEETIVHETKLCDSFDGGGEEVELCDSFEVITPHCLVCNVDLTPTVSDDHIPVFKTQTSTSQRRVAIFLSSLIGQTLTSRKAHSDILCRRCFNLLDRVDSLEVEIKETKEEIVNKYQETVSVYGRRARRRRKPATAKQKDYVFPKVEPEDEADQLLDIEVDGNFEPQMDDLMDEDPNLQDDDWEPEFKKPRIKRETTDVPETVPIPTKRKRGRPRKDANRPKAEAVSSMREDEAAASIQPVCPVCSITFTFLSQMRRHIRYEHPEFDASELDSSECNLVSKPHLKDIHMETEDDGIPEDDMEQTMDFHCQWCDVNYMEKDLYDKHQEEHGTQAFQQYLTKLEEAATTREDELYRLDGAVISSGRSNRDITECSLCGYICSSEVKMEQHLDLCHERSPRQCNLCGENCINKSFLHDHLIHHFNGVIQCPVCSVKFSFRIHLLAHLEYYHSSGYAIVCANCNTEFTDYVKFESHQARDHGLGFKMKCNVCKKEILSVDVEKHLAFHEARVESKESRIHACNLCHASFMFLSHLYHHKYQHHLSAFPFKCSECERRFRTWRMLCSHRWGHRYGKHQCPGCHLKYRQVDQLKRHLLMVHPEMDGFRCKFCSSLLKNYSIYVAHLKLKHPNEAGYNKRPVKCRLCGKSFAHKSQWKYHMRNHMRSYQTCNICGITVKNLHLHMNLHTREKKYECNECGVVYHNKASFHFHVKRVHMGEEVRKHLCETCNKTFLTPADLRIHVSRVHQNERNFWCTYCKKGYKSKVSLTYHERLHTGERPHLCTLCGLSFRVPSYLKRHMEHDHHAEYKGIYFKQGRPKSQVERSYPLRQHQHKTKQCQPSGKDLSTRNVKDAGTAIPEVVQITVPVDMGDDVKSVVGTMQDLGMESLELEQGGVVYVVYEN